MEIAFTGWPRPDCHWAIPGSGGRGFAESSTKPTSCKRPPDVDPKRIGVIGFSAGGHLCARLSTDFGRMAYEAVDEADEQDCRSDFSMLIYPAYLRTKDGKIATELPVSTKVPPTFIVQTKDDKGFAPGTICHDQELRAAGFSSTFHPFETGGHGYGLPSRKSG